MLKVDTENRILGLDALRSIALLMAILQHSFVLLDNYFPKITILGFFNRSAVDVFFVLSGYLIAMILDRKLKEKKSFHLIDIWSFYKRRCLKTFPMYFLTIIICLVLSYFGVYYAQDFSWKFLFFIQNLTVSNFHFLPHTYSLSVEEWFYIIFALALAIKFKINKYNPLITIGLIWLIIALSLRIYLHFQEITFWDGQIRKSIIARIDAPIYGIFAYFLLKKYAETIVKHKNLILILGILFYTIFTIILLKNYSSLYNNVFYFTLEPISLCLVLCYFVYFKPYQMLIKKFVFISLSSYSIYLIHLPLLYCFIKYFPAKNDFTSLFYLIFYYFLTFLIGIFFYYTVEKPILNFRK